ncbi:glycosyl hydrolases family 18-domain-containing protein [Lentinula aciculospora]|uniref:Glycosyl hydrolases family 18-domain-containing protein n=1 Tax=Lentinula aciculospora TaxID=153920 RepID=A0A9W9DMC1_9AGAR|nr:glycosyl hydrolases family 18-domain-containing protein [Lentinula aciculospora]
MIGLGRILVSLLSFSALHVHATQVMHRPERFNTTPPVVTTESNPETHVIQKRASAKTQVAYFTNWGIYAANFQPTDIIPSTLTHILYAFADVSPDTGAISLTDLYADEQKHFPTDSWDETGNNLYGCLKQMYLLKLANRSLKVLLSIGGWTYSQDGHFDFVTDATLRANFVTQAVSYIENFGFDGIDLDYEYPANTAQGQGFSDLITELRTAFDNLAAQKGDSTLYQLTAAVSANASNYQWLNIPQVDTALTYWNLMSYDYAGSWLSWSDNQANLYDGQRTGINTDMAVKGYIAAGATADKINIGIPIYGRAFEETSGLGEPFNGIGPGTFEAGVYQYKVLPLAGASVFENTTDVTSYSYNPTTEELVSYDTPNIVKMKAQYVNTNGLAGAMFWDLSPSVFISSDITGNRRQPLRPIGAEHSQDSADTSTSLVQAALTEFSTLDSTLNHINYPDSEWDNIRSNMGKFFYVRWVNLNNYGLLPLGESTGSSTTTPTSTSATSASSTGTAITTSTGATPTGACSSVAAWSSAIAYIGGSEVSYNGQLWEAQWWTENDTPGGSAGVWIIISTC